MQNRRRHFHLLANLFYFGRSAHYFHCLFHALAEFQFSKASFRIDFCFHIDEFFDLQNCTDPIAFAYRLQIAIIRLFSEREKPFGEILSSIDVFLSAIIPSFPESPSNQTPFRQTETPKEKIIPPFHEIGTAFAFQNGKKIFGGLGDISNEARSSGTAGFIPSRVRLSVHHDFSCCRAVVGIEDEPIDAGFQFRHVYSEIRVSSLHLVEQKNLSFGVHQFYVHICG